MGESGGLLEGLQGKWRRWHGRQDTSLYIMDVQAFYRFLSHGASCVEHHIPTEAFMLHEWKLFPSRCTQQSILGYQRS